MSNPKVGLTSKEAKQLLKQHGKNTIISHSKISPFKILLTQLTDPLVIILFIAAAVSGFLGEILDASIIVIVLLLNAFIGFFQEYRAEKTVESLRKMIPQNVKVKRDGEWVQVPSEDIVPGDVIELFEGNKVPSDGEIIHCNEFTINESVLTGESVPVYKEVGSVFMGTVIVKGRALIKVTNTGMETKFGQIAKMTSETEDSMSPLKEEISHIAKYIGITVIVVCVSIFAYLVFKNGTSSILDSLIYSVAIAVAAVPEGLATTMTITLALSARKLAQKNALIKKLTSIETFGCATVICTDKTGTLTKNQMTVVQVMSPSFSWMIQEDYFVGTGEKEDDKELGDIIECGVLCNEASLSKTPDGKIQMIGDPTEGCLLVLSSKYHSNGKDITEDYNYEKTLSFDSDRKRMTSIYEKNGKKIAFSKGAPSSVLDACESIQIAGKVHKLNEKTIHSWKNNCHQAK